MNEDPTIPGHTTQINPVPPPAICDHENYVIPEDRATGTCLGCFRDVRVEILLNNRMRRIEFMLIRISAVVGARFPEGSD